MKNATTPTVHEHTATCFESFCHHYGDKVNALGHSAALAKADRMLSGPTNSEEE